MKDKKNCGNCSFKPNFKYSHYYTNFNSKKVYVYEGRCKVTNKIILREHNKYLDINNVIKNCKKHNKIKN